MLTPMELGEKVYDVIGEYVILQDYRKGSSRTGVWKIQRTSDGTEYFVKSFSRKNRWHPEVFAYENWIPAIAPYAPELVEKWDTEEVQAILITSLGGITLREATYLSDQQKEQAYYRAGELTRILHARFTGSFFGRPDCKGQPIELFHHDDPVEYLRHSILTAFEQGKQMGSFTTHEIKLANWALAHVDLFQDSDPRATSWDSSPNNWMVDEETGEFLGMIDFENMLWGFDVDHFTILFERYFPNFPKGQDAFFAGYGGNVLKEKALQIKIACIKAAVNSIVWGLGCQDERTVQLARNMLASLEIV